jgi:hypothetical protein
MPHRRRDLELRLQQVRQIEDALAARDAIARQLEAADAELDRIVTETTDAGLPVVDAASARQVQRQAVYAARKRHQQRLTAPQLPGQTRMTDDGDVEPAPRRRRSGGGATRS